MCENFPNIRITEGNAFALLLPLRTRTYVSSQPIDEDIDYTLLNNILFTFGGVEYATEVTERGVKIILPDTLAVGTYNAILTAEYLGNDIRAAYESAVTIVPWSAQSTAEQYITGSPIVMCAAYVLSGAMTDAELEELKEEYREKNEQLAQAIADYEEAKDAFIEKAEMLEDVAKETTSQSILTAATNAYASAEAAKTAAEALPSLNQIVSGIIGSVSLPFNLGGVELDGASPSTAAELFANMDKVVSITDTESIYMKNITTKNFPILKKLSFYAMTTYLGGAYFMYGAKCLEEVDLPNLQSGNMSGFLMEVPNLKRANLKYSNVLSIVKGDEFLGLCPNLIDVECGAGFVRNSPFLVKWNPTNALLNSETSLLTTEDIAAGFTSNLEKLLYNIREHIAANLTDRTGQSALTLQMSDNVKAAIQADKETSDAFTNKNWIIA